MEKSGVIVKKTHNDGLDLLRVASMLGVIWVHLSIYLPIPDDKRIFFVEGAYGVQIFFVLSGYLAAFSLYKKLDWREYYKKRALRIIPPYYTVIIIAMFWSFLQKKL